MLENIKAVIFDLDGTLVDSMWMWEKIDEEYLGRFNIPLPKSLNTEIEGMSFSETAKYFKERFHLKDSLEKIKDDWNKMAYEKYANEVFFKEGALEFVKYLRNKNIVTGIATSNSRELVEALMRKGNFSELFDSIRTSCEVAKGKPAPDIYQLVAKDLNVSPDDCLVFEDVVQGIQAGKSAGMKVCAVYDENAAEYDGKKKELADYYINTFEEIPYLLEIHENGGLCLQ